jgi:hypothetical protein
MIPDCVDIGGPWKVLPPGLHDATLDEVEQRFATNGTRARLMEGLRLGCEALRVAGCSVVYVDGSFVTEKPFPGDFDACWYPIGVDPTKLDPVLLDFDNGRSNQKAKFGGEFFLSSGLAAPLTSFVQYFRRDKHTLREKGLIRIRLA